MSPDDSQTDIAMEKPRIIPIPNGPLHLINSEMPQLVDNIRNSRREPIFWISKIALCRCGSSGTKPFCDRTHAKIGFSSENKNTPATNDKRKDYFGAKIIVHDNRRLCSHSAECLRNLETVFRLDRRPWINPDESDVKSVIETVRKCPSGALSYSIEGVEHRDQSDRDPVVIVDRNGPYRIEGGIELVDTENWGIGASKEHYSLCRCGASNNKPFCDGMHLSIDFKDDINK